MPIITSEKELNTHPVARVIPWPVWRNEGFNFKGNKALLRAMEGSFDEASSKLLSVHEKKLALIGLFFSHHQQSSTVLLDVAFSLLDGVEDRFSDFIIREIFHAIIIVGHEDLFQEFCKRIEPNRLRSLIEENAWKAYSQAACYGHLHLLRYFEALLPQDVPKMIAARKYSAYNSAVSNNQLHILLHLEALMPGKTQEMISVDDYESYYYAAIRGHLDVLYHFQSIIQSDTLIRILQAERLPETLQPFSWRMFDDLCENGQLDVLKYLQTQVSGGLLLEIICSNDYQPYRFAAAGGHCNILLYLEEQLLALKPRSFFSASVSAILYPMITAREFYAYSVAASNGHRAVLEHIDSHLVESALTSVFQFLNLSSVSREKRLKDDARYQAYISAVHSGHIHILNYLEALLPEQIETILHLNDCSSYRKALKMGQMEVVDHIESLVPKERLITAIRSTNYSTYGECVFSGRYQSILHLEALMPAHEVINMIEADDFIALKLAKENNDLGAQTILFHLFAYPQVFAQLDFNHHKDYWNIRKFAHTTLSQWRQLVDEEGQITLTDKECMLGYYLIRYFLWENSMETINNLIFLLSIPGIATLARMSDGQGANSLVAMAQETRNVAALELLRPAPVLVPLAEYSSEQPLQWNDRDMYIPVQYSP